MLQQHLIRDFLVEKNILKSNINDISEIIDFFEYLNNSKEKFNSAYLLNYIYKNISSDEVAKRKTTARDFEDFLGILLNGIITDELNRKNENQENICIENKFITKFVISNTREKADLEFSNNFKLSVKTLINSNKEINLGSFEKTALFYLLDVEDFLNERKGKSVLFNSEKLNIGLGSKKLLENLFKYLKQNNNFEIFKNRFLEMSKYIFSDDFKMVLNDFKDAGYKVKWQILNSADFGVPQVRKRVIIVGVRNDIDFDYQFPSAILKKQEYKTIKDAIFDLPRKFTESIPNHTGSEHKVKINNYLGNRKLEWNKPSPTIVGRGGGTGGAVIHPHPDGERRLSVRECARIQSFLDDFEFNGSNGACYRQIGNAVPPEMAYHLAKNFHYQEKELN